MQSRLRPCGIGLRCEAGPKQGKDYFYPHRAAPLTPSAATLVAPKAGTPANPNRVTVKLDPKTGIVTGSAAILNATGTKVTRTQPFRGMLVKDPLGDGEDAIGGYFLLPDAAKLIQSGRLEITEPESPE